MSPASLTFTPSSWSNPTTITVRAIDDRVAEGDHLGIITHAVASNDPAFDRVKAPSLTVSISDNDSAGVRLLHTDGATQVAEGAGGDAYSLVLNSKPMTDVTISVDPDDQLQAAPSTVTFTPDDWAFGHPIEVAAVDDEISEGPHEGRIAHRVSSEDPFYDGLQAPTLTAAIADDDGVVTSLTFLGPATAVSGEQVRVSARLTDTKDGMGLPGKNVVFRLKKGSTTVRTATAMTDAAGTAAADLTLNLTPGAYSMELSFPGDPFTLPSSDSDPFSITKRVTAIELTAPAAGRALDPIPLDATLVDATTGAPIASTWITFSLVHQGTVIRSGSAKTAQNGRASTTLTSNQSGALEVRVSFQEDESWFASSDTAPIQISSRDAVLAVYPASGQYEVGAMTQMRLSDTENDSGLPYATVTLEVMDGDAVLQTSQATTDSSGRGYLWLSAWLMPGDYTMVVTYEGNGIWEGAVGSAQATIAKHPLLLDGYSGPAEGARGQNVIMRTRLIDGLTGEPRGSGEEVEFRLGGTTRSAAVDGEGWAQVQMPLDQEPGDHTLVVDIVQRDLYEAEPLSVPFQVRWEHSFVSQVGTGTVLLNPSTKEFRFSAPGDQTSIKKDSSMQVQTLPNGQRAILLRFEDPEVRMQGVFNLDSGMFTAAVTTSMNTYPLARLL